MEFLEKNMDWLEERLAALAGPSADACCGRLVCTSSLAHVTRAGYYILVDCPGQAELYTHHSSIATVLHRLEKLRYRVRRVPCPIPASACVSLTRVVRCGAVDRRSSRGHSTLHRRGKVSVGVVAVSLHAREVGAAPCERALES